MNFKCYLNSLIEKEETEFGKLKKETPEEDKDKKRKELKDKAEKNLGKWSRERRLQRSKKWKYYEFW